jgi:hypothetical protein
MLKNSDKTRYRAAAALEKSCLELIEANMLNSERAASIAIAFLHMVAPLYFWRLKGVSTEQEAVMHVARARRALKLLHSIEAIQHTEGGGCKEVKEILWKALLEGALGATDPKVEKRLTEGLLSTKSENTHGERKTLDEVIRGHFSDRYYDRDKRIARMLSRVTAEHNATVVNRLMHAQVNQMHLSEVAETFGPKQ